MSVHADAPLLSVRDLHKSFASLHGRVKVLNGVAFDLAAGSTLALVGELVSATGAALASVAPGVNRDSCCAWVMTSSG